MNKRRRKKLLGETDLWKDGKTYNLEWVIEGNRGRVLLDGITMIDETFDEPPRPFAYVRHEAGQGLMGSAEDFEAILNK